MEKIIFKGTCIESGEKLTGSLVQWDDGTHTIAFKETETIRYMSPVHPDTVECISHKLLKINDIHVRYHGNAVLAATKSQKEADLLRDNMFGLNKLEYASIKILSSMMGRDQSSYHNESERSYLISIAVQAARELLEQLE